MAKKITINVEDVTLEAELYQCPAADALARALPITARLSRWGDEYYGAVEADISEDDTVRTEMKVGELAYWAPGRALCIFFGPTPASVGSEPRAASDVVPIGKITGDVSVLKRLGGSVTVTVA